MNFHFYKQQYNPNFLVSTKNMIFGFLDSKTQEWCWIGPFLKRTCIPTKFTRVTLKLTSCGVR